MKSVVHKPTKNQVRLLGTENPISQVVVNYDNNYIKINTDSKLKKLFFLQEKQGDTEEVTKKT